MHTATDRGVACHGGIAGEGHRLADGEPTLDADDPLRHVRQAVLIEDRVLEADVELVDAAAGRALEDGLAVDAGDVVVRVVRGGIVAATREDAVADRRAVVAIDAGGRVDDRRVVAVATRVGLLVEAVGAAVRHHDRHVEVDREILVEADLHRWRHDMAHLLVQQVTHDRARRVVGVAPLAQQRGLLEVEVVANPEVQVELVVAVEGARHASDVRRLRRRAESEVQAQ